MSGDGGKVLCNTYDFFRYVLKRWDRNGYPVMLENAHDIDELLQWATVAFGDYSLTVFEFIKEQEAELIIRKLKGH